MISIVIVSYNSLNYIENCLNTIGLDGDSECEIIVVDNHGSDGVRQYIRDNHAYVKFIDFTHNRGFGGGCNIGASYASGEVVVMLNPDAYVSIGNIRLLCCKLLDMDSVGACGPRLINLDGSHQVGDAGWSINLASMISHSFLIHKLFKRIKSIYLTNNKLLNEDMVLVDWVCGACLLVKSNVWRAVGGFNEEIFMYGEDVDIGCRIRERGWDVAYFPRISATHVQGASQKNENNELYYSEKWIISCKNSLLLRHGVLYTSFTMASFGVGFLLQAAFLSLANIFLNGRLDSRKIINKLKYGMASIKLSI